MDNSSSPLETLRQLKEMLDAGALTPTEFEALKQRLVFTGSTTAPPATPASASTEPASPAATPPAATPIAPLQPPVSTTPPPPVATPPAPVPTPPTPAPGQAAVVEE